ncbi:hypothetical protein GQ600_25647 [Phytophthora cactorum]|nr:hypothetical protein GQ600_25647 [Phytophthora cactorum]
MRVSPYPLRVRTTPQGLATPLCARSRTPTSGGPRPPAPRRVTSSPLEPDQFQLIVKPIVKNSVGQNETSGDTLSNFLVDGSTFQDILGKLRETFSHRIKERAVKQDGFWSMEPSTMSVWTKLMQLKYNNHIVDSEKTEHAWNLWVASGRGKTIKLMIYEYGTAITKARDLDAFFAACIRPVKLTAPEQQQSTDFARLSRSFKRTGNPASGQRLSCGGCGVTISPGTSTDLLGTLQLRILAGDIIQLLRRRGRAAVVKLD